MKFTKLRKRYRWEPMEFDSNDILLMIENDHCMEFVSSYNGQLYWIGVASDFHHITRKFFDHLYYINDQEFTTFHEFKSKATIGGQLFANLNDKIDVIDTFEGDPKHYYNYLTDLKKRNNSYIQ